MALKKLLKWHRFSLQTNEFVVKDDTGSLNRKDGWITTHENLHGHLQVARSNSRRDNTVDYYGIVEQEISHILFHNYASLDIKENYRILVNKSNPKFVISDFEVNSEIRIFQFVGNREPVSLRRLTLFELYLKEITRQSL